MGPRHECPGRTAPHRLGDGEVKLGTRGLPSTEPPRPDAALEPATRDPRPAGALGLCPAPAPSAQKALGHSVSASHLGQGLCTQRFPNLLVIIFRQFTN